MLTDLLPVACSDCFLITPQTICPRVVIPAWAGPCHIKTLHFVNLPISQSHRDIFSIESPYSQMTLACVKLI